MFAWLVAHWIDMVLIAAVVLSVVLSVRVMVRDRRAGKAPCGGSCASCGACHSCASCRAVKGKPIPDRLNAVK